ncbi:MAG: hypothetical protein QM764_09525 [Chitinophagaceae bacterium]
MTKSRHNKHRINDQSLHELISNLAVSYTPLAARRSSFFINDIDRKINLQIDNEVFISIVEKMILIILICENDACIRLSAKMYHDVVLLHIQVTNVLNSETVISQLDQLHIKVNELYGVIDVSTMPDKVASISFAILNMAPDTFQAIVENEQSMMKEAV